MDESTYVNDGAYYQPEVPAETKAQLIQEERDAFEAQPFMRKVLEWFDEAIENTNRVDIVISESRRKNKPVEVIVEAYDITRELLEAKKGELEQLAKTLD